MKKSDSSPHRREAAHFHRSAASAANEKKKNWLLQQAEQHEQVADLSGEPGLELSEGEQ